MKLTDDGAKLFYKLNWGLLFHANKKYDIIEGLNEPDFKDLDMGKIYELHKKAYKDHALIDSFANDNPLSFSPDELEIVKSWKKYLSGDFYLMGSEKGHAIFLSDKEYSKAYAVYGLYDDLADIPSYAVPLRMNTILLPFDGKIVICGIYNLYRVHFGSGIKNGLKRNLKEAKSTFGLIKSLEEPIKKKSNADEEMIAYYAGSDKNYDEYYYEIQDMLKEKPHLIKAYRLARGKSGARKTNKKFRKLGLKSGWFAILDDVIIASGSSENEARSAAESIVPDEMRGHVHVFKFRK